MSFINNFNRILQDSKVRALVVFVMIIAVAAGFIAFVKIKSGNITQQAISGQTDTTQVTGTQQGLKFQPGVGTDKGLEKIISKSDAEKTKTAGENLTGSNIESFSTQPIDADDCMKQYEKLKQELAAQDARNKQLQGDLAKTKQDIDNLQKKVDDAQKMLKDANQSLAQAANQLQKERNRNAALLASAKQGVSIPGDVLQSNKDQITQALDQLSQAQGGFGGVTPTTMEYVGGQYAGTIINTTNLDFKNQGEKPVPQEMLQRLEKDGMLDRSSLPQGTVTFSQLEQALSRKIVAKAGDILFAVVDNTVNSDAPGVVLAHITSGPLKGSKIIGNFTATSNNKLSLNFNTINMPKATSTFGFNGVAIDPDTAEAAVATDVDHHYLLRYGSFFASTFLEGLMNAITIEKSRFLVSNSGVPGTNLVQLPVPVGDENNNFSTKDQMLYSLGTVGKKATEKLNFIDKKPTIVVEGGTMIGVLLTQDMVFGEPVKPNNTISFADKVKKQVDKELASQQKKEQQREKQQAREDAYASIVDRFEPAIDLNKSSNNT